MANETQKVVNGKKAYFNLPWTPLRKADRVDIARGVPSLPGIYEIFWEDENKKLHLFSLDPAWQGGLRASISEKLDQDHEHDKTRKKIIEDKNLVYRFVFCDNWPDIVDVLYLLLSVYRPDLKDLPHSGRYAELFIKESPLA